MGEQSAVPGPKKIIDCKVGSDGQQFYKVKWEPTWEPAENLATCQHLITEFWTFVNTAKCYENAGLQRMPLTRPSSTSLNFQRLSEKDKSDVEQLISRSANTSVGNATQLPSNYILNMESPVASLSLSICPSMNLTETSALGTPSSLKSPHLSPLLSPLCNIQTSSRNIDSNILPDVGPTFNTTKKQANGSTPKYTDDVDKSMGGCGDNSVSATASMKYIDNFNNPYVKLIIVCKICNKEAAKHPKNWKRHYLTHSEDKTPPKKKRLNNTADGVVKLEGCVKEEDEEAYFY